MRTHRGGVMAWLDRRDAARLVGAEIPDEAADIRFADWQPSGDLAYHEALVRFDIGQEHYRAWIERAGLTVLAAGETPPEGRAAWLAPPEMPRPDWWTPTAAIPPGTVWCRVGAYGSLAMKWEGGAVFAHLVDTGHRTEAG